MVVVMVLMVVLMVVMIVVMMMVIVVMMVWMVQVVVVVTVVSGVTMSPLDCCCPGERRETRACIETDSYYDLSQSLSFTPSCPSDCHGPARLQVLYLSVESQYSH